MERNFYFLHKLPPDKVNKINCLIVFKYKFISKKQKQCLNLDSLDTDVIIAFVHKR